MHTFVLAPFVISRLAAEEAMTEMTDEIYSLNFKKVCFKGVPVTSCAVSCFSPVPNSDTGKCLCVQFGTLHQL